MDKEFICQTLESLRSEQQAVVADMEQGILDMERAKQAFELAKGKAVALGAAITEMRKQLGCDETPSY